jgi:hypothetical protein
MQLLGLVLARTLASPCLGCEPKARVMTLYALLNFWKHACEVAKVLGTKIFGGQRLI